MSKLFKIILFCYIIFAFFLAQQRTIQISKAKTQPLYTIVRDAQPGGTERLKVKVYWRAKDIEAYIWTQ